MAESSLHIRNPPSRLVNQIGELFKCLLFVPFRSQIEICSIAIGMYHESVIDKKHWSSAPSIRLRNRAQHRHVLQSLMKRILQRYRIVVRNLAYSLEINNLLPILFSQ